MYFIAYKNILRRKSRTILAALGVTMGIMLVIVMISFSQSSDVMMEDFKKTMSGSVEITQKSNSASGGMGAFDPSVSVLDKNVIDKSERVNGVKGVASRIYIFVKVEGTDVIPSGMEAMPSDFQEMMSGTYLIGVDPKMEKEVKGYMTNIVSGTMIRKGTHGVCVIGSGLEEKSKKSVGDRIVVTYDKDEDGIIESSDKFDFDVIGVYDSDSMMTNDNIIISQDEARAINGMTSSQISMVVLDIVPEKEDSAIRKLRVLLPDADVGINKQMMKTIDDFSDRMSLMFMMMMIFSVSIGFIGIINTMIMSVVERTKEIGVLMATGWKKLDVIKLIMIESVVISILGTAGGIGLGVLGLSGMTVLFPGTGIVLNLELFLSASLFGIIVGVGGGLYPAWRAASMNPLEAFRDG
ncbi:MAG: FtsX-like permease family protein [Halobacteriota archaeon]|nr:FtsX-like permease family protein [Halobacteriota archaeon]